MASGIIKPWINHPTAKTQKIVLQVMRANTHPIGMTTHQIYAKAHEMFPNETEYAPPLASTRIPPGAKGRHGQPPKPIPEPPHRTHPIRSVKYLKREVLSNMDMELRRVRAIRDNIPEASPNKKLKPSEIRAWYWRLIERDHTQGEIPTSQEPSS